MAEIKRHQLQRLVREIPSLWAVRNRWEGVTVRVVRASRDPGEFKKQLDVEADRIWMFIDPKGIPPIMAEYDLRQDRLHSEGRDVLSLLARHTKYMFVVKDDLVLIYKAPKGSTWEELFGGP